MEREWKYLFGSVSQRNGLSSLHKKKKGNDSVLEERKCNPWIKESQTKGRMNLDSEFKSMKNK